MSSYTISYALFRYRKMAQVYDYLHKQPEEEIFVGDEYIRQDDLGHDVMDQLTTTLRLAVIRQRNLCQCCPTFTYESHAFLRFDLDIFPQNSRNRAILRTNLANFARMMLRELYHPFLIARLPNLEYHVEIATHIILDEEEDTDDENSTKTESN